MPPIEHTVTANDRECIDIAECTRRWIGETAIVVALHSD